MLVDWTLIALFLPTAFFISVTPGMCMTLALTLGLSIGYKRTLWMMAGELLGVACVMVAIRMRLLCSSGAVVHT
jgi:threonine/homoserine/homoserine lactone efflux protein